MTRLASVVVASLVAASAARAQVSAVQARVRCYRIVFESWTPAAAQFVAPQDPILLELTPRFFASERGDTLSFLVRFLNGSQLPFAPPVSASWRPVADTTVSFQVVQAYPLYGSSVTLTDSAAGVRGVFTAWTDAAFRGSTGQWTSILGNGVTRAERISCAPSAPAHHSSR